MMLSKAKQLESGPADKAAPAEEDPYLARVRELVEKP